MVRASSCGATGARPASAHRADRAARRHALPSEAWEQWEDDERCRGRIAAGTRGERHPLEGFPSSARSAKHRRCVLRRSSEAASRITTSRETPRRLRSSSSARRGSFACSRAASSKAFGDTMRPRSRSSSIRKGIDRLSARFHEPARRSARAARRRAPRLSTVLLCRRWRRGEAAGQRITIGHAGEQIELDRRSHPIGAFLGELGPQVVRAGAHPCRDRRFRTRHDHADRPSPVAPHGSAVDAGGSIELAAESPWHFLRAREIRHHPPAPAHVLDWGRANRLAARLVDDGRGRLGAPPRRFESSSRRMTSTTPWQASANDRRWRSSARRSSSEKLPSRRRPPRLPIRDLVVGRALQRRSGLHRERKRASAAMLPLCR